MDFWLEMTVAILSFSYTWLVAFVSVTPEVLVLLGWMFDVDAMGPNQPHILVPVGTIM